MFDKARKPRPKVYANTGKTGEPEHGNCRFSRIATCPEHGICRFVVATISFVENVGFRLENQNVLILGGIEGQYPSVFVSSSGFFGK